MINHKYIKGITGPEFFILFPFINESIFYCVTANIVNILPYTQIFIIIFTCIIIFTKDDVLPK